MEGDVWADRSGAHWVSPRHRSAYFQISKSN